MKNRKIILLICIFMTQLLIGCGQEEYLVEYGIDGYVYLSRKLQSMEGVNDLRVIGDYLYYMQEGDKETSVNRVSVASMVSGEGGLDFSGKETLALFRNITFELPEEAEGKEEDIDFIAAMDGGVKQNGGIELEKKYGSLSLKKYAVAPDGNIYFYLSASVGEYFSMNIVGGVLCRQNPEGEQVYRVYLPQMIDFAVDVEGRGVILTEEGIHILDKDGKEAVFLPAEDYCEDGKGIREELFTDSEGRVYYSRINDNYFRTTWEISGGKSVQMVNTGGFMGDGFMNYAAAPKGNLFEFSITTDAVLYLYDRKTNSRKKLLNWWESGLMGSNIRSVAAITEDILLVSYSGILGEESGIYQLVKTPVDTLPEKELLVIAAPQSSFSLQKAVMLFNADSDTYRVVLESYGAELREGAGWVCPQLDASLVSSNPPDMINLSNLNIVKYARKGVLEDLAPYLEKSDILDKEDIPDNILKGMTFDGKLLSIPFSFDIYTIGARIAQINGLDSWTMEDVYQLTKQYPESMGGMVETGYGEREQRGWLLKEFCARYYLEKFVDWEKGKCSFNNDEFRRLIVWAGEYGWGPEDVEVQVGDVVRNDVYIPEDALLVSQRRLDFTSLAHLEMQYGEKACLIGYPTVDGKGYFPAYASEGLGINSNSSHKEAAWEFLEYFYQVHSNQLFGEIPASKTKIRELYEKETTPEYIDGVVDENGEPVMRRKGIIGVGLDYVEYYVISKEQADAILDAMETADFRPMSEEEEMIVKIVAEEAESYFSGSKSLEEVTEIIQNRAELVLKEKG